MKITGTARAVMFRPPDLAVTAAEAVDVVTAVTAAEAMDVTAAVGADVLITMSYFQFY